MIHIHKTTVRCETETQEWPVLTRETILGVGVFQPYSPMRPGASAIHHET
jgi:hypothetical protein